MSYKYLSGEVPKRKINYSYSVFEGQKFLDNWLQSRQLGYEGDLDFSLNFEPLTNSPTERLFLKWINVVNENCQIDREALDLLIKRFEVTKRIYSLYDENFRPVDKSHYLELNLYQLLAFILCREYYRSKRLPLLNALIKLNDILLSVNKRGLRLDGELLRYTLEKEVKFVLELRT